MPEPVRLSLIVPCYQEGEALAVWATLLPDVPGDELLFVDDGSTDVTAQRLTELQRLDGRVRVLTHERNRGVGAAQRTGIEASTGDVVVVYDADRTYPLEDVPRLVAALDEPADIATATPFAEADAGAVIPWTRGVLSQGAAWAYRVVLGSHARDIRVFTCAFRAYRGEMIRALSFRSDGFPAAGEILGLALLRGQTVVEVPSHLRTRVEGASKMRVVRTTCAHLGVLLRLLFARIRGKT